MFNPLDLSKITEEIVTCGDKKKYYRFRPTRFYGGIATADTVGCNLRCKFCWSSNSVWNSKKTGKFYTPKQIANNLNETAIKNGFSQLRISGGEPTIGKEHLIKILNNIQPNFLFILETNGILLGKDKSYVQELSKFSNIHVRVSLKGINSNEFSLLTGAIKDGFDYQIQSLKNLKDEKISFNIAVASTKKNKQELINKLNDMGLSKIIIEEEEIKIYPNVKERLEKEKILQFFKR